MLNHPIFTMIVSLATIGALVSPGALIASPKPPKDKPPELSAVLAVKERSDAQLQELGDQVRSYTLKLGDNPITICIDYIPNRSGNNEVPADLSDYAVNAIAKLGPQFRTIRKFGGIVATPGPAGLLAAGDCKGANFVLTGSFQGATEEYKKVGNTDIPLMGGGGRTQWNFDYRHNKTVSVVPLTVTFTLEGPDRISIPGAFATYRINFVKQQQNEHSFGIYLAGSGLSHDNAATVAQSMDDAVYDITAVAIVRLVGNALQVPYYRCGAKDNSGKIGFEPDRELDKRVQDTLLRLPRPALEANVKHWMMAQGYPVDLSQLDQLTSQERAIAAVEMQRRSLPDTDDGWVSYAFSLWQKLDYANGSLRVERFLAFLAKTRAEQQIAAERMKQQQQQQGAEAPKPNPAQEPVSMPRPVVRRGVKTTSVKSSALTAGGTPASTGNSPAKHHSNRGRKEAAHLDSRMETTTPVHSLWAFTRVEN